MKTRKLTWIQILCIALIPLLFSVGCAKREAQKVQTLAQQAKDAASQAQAPGYATKAFNDASRLFNQADQKFNEGSYKEAIELYQQAQARFEGSIQITNEVKPRIQAMITKIEDALSQASDNLEKARAGGAVTAEDLNPAQQTLDNLNGRMETDIRGEVDEEKLNAFLAEVNQSIQQTESLALAHLKPQASAAKQEIQDLITRAQELNADTHAPNEFGQVMEKFTQLESAERDGQWQNVIDLAATLKEPLNQVIQTSQEKAAGDILRQTEQQIAQAKQMNIQGVDAYTTAVQQAETSLQTGKEALQNKDYAGAIAGADAAKAALTQAYQAVGQLAQQHVETAKGNLQKALDKEAEKYAAAVVARVKEAISSAEELLQQQNFAQAYLTAQQALQTSANAIDAARRGKAQVALQTVEKPFSVLHAQGGAKYAADAYKAALASMEDLRTKMKQGEFESVVSSVPAAAQVVQKGLEALAKAAKQYIGRAESALADAKTAGAPEWVGVQFSHASKLISAAQENLSNARFLSSIQSAESAIQAAHDSEAKAYQLQTEQNLRKADDFLALAKRAEQDRLSPLAYRQAVQSKEETSHLLQQKKFKDAFHNSKSTVQKADRALNNLVLTAKEKTDSALQAKAMHYSKPEMDSALSLLTQAEEAQKAQNFSAANDLAIQSAKLAEQAEHFTWKQRSYRLLRDLEGSKEELDYHNAAEKAPALYQQVLANLAEAKVAQIDEDYKDSYQYAAKAQSSKQAVWAAMQTELNQVLASLQQTADWMGENSLDPLGRELKIKLMDILPPLEQTIALKDWKSAYKVAANCQKTAAKLTHQMEQHNRSIMSGELYDALRPYKKQVALAIVPGQQDALNKTLKSLQNPADGETYAEILEKYQKATDTVDELPTTIVEQANQKTENIASILQQANETGASQFYKGWYRELTSDLQMLRNAIQGKNFGEISKYFRKLEREAPKLLAATQLTNSEEEYYKELVNNLNQMNNVFQDFGFLGRLSKQIIITTRLTEHKLDEGAIDMYRSLQGNMSAKTLRVNAELLEDTVAGLQPPKTVQRVHVKALKAFHLFTQAAQAFETYGNSDAYDIHYREKALSDGYDKLHQALKINGYLLYKINDERKLKGWDKIVSGIKDIEKSFGDFYFNFGKQ